MLHIRFYPSPLLLTTLPLIYILYAALHYTSSHFISLHFFTLLDDLHFTSLPFITLSPGIQCQVPRVQDVSECAVYYFAA